MIKNKLSFCHQYVRYLFTARSKFRVHSPFVYSFYTDVILEKNHNPEVEAIEKVRSSLLKQRSLLEITDFGAGANGNEYMTRFRNVSSVTRHSSVSLKYGALLYRIVKDLKPQNVLEIGTAMGISTMYIARAAPQSHILTMEGCAVTAEKANENFEAAGLNNIEMILGNFDHTLHESLEKIGKLDFVFIDGNHRREPTLEYFNMMLPQLHAGSVLIIDDIHWSAGMGKAWKEICEHEKVSITIDLFRLGIVLFKEDIAKENFVLRF